MMPRLPALAVLVLALALGGLAHAREDGRPNILLVVFEDMGPRIGAYGDGLARTPALDAFAREAVLFTRAFATAGVCAPSRSALITGVHQQTLGTQHMRTSAFGSAHAPDGFSIGYDAVPPPEVKGFPELLRAAGYHTISGLAGLPASDKRDYQFGAPFTLWDAEGQDSHWRGRPKGAPFFAMATLATTHEGFLWPEIPVRDSELARQTAALNRALLAGKEAVTDPLQVRVPPFLPDTPAVRADLARHYDNIHFTDKRFARLLAALGEDGLDDETVVIVIADNGDGLPRAKRTVYDSGILVPLLVRMPDRSGAGSVRDELVSLVDLAPTILALAGISAPPWMQGRVVLGPQRQPPPAHVFASTDRLYDLPDRVKAVRDQRFKYIRNFHPEHALLRPLDYRDHLPSMAEIWRLRDEGTLAPLLRSYVEGPRPAEELYDTLADPDEVRNLAGDRAHDGERRRLAAALDAWLAGAQDLSAMPEREMVEAMWPGLVQPVTAPPEAALASEGGRAILRLRPSTAGASIGYRFVGRGETGWRLYARPLALEGPVLLEAKAIRYGYAESSVLRMPVAP